MKQTVNQTVIELVQGDITTQDVEAIVNAANSSLLGGGGVDGAIHRVGGVEILKECKTLNGCQTGDAKITTGGKLKAGHVIHTVGPVYRDGMSGEPDLLASCYQISLEVAVENSIATVAFPSVSTGVYGYPYDDAAEIALSTVKAFVEQNTAILLVRFVLFNEPIYQAFENAMKKVMI